MVSTPCALAISGLDPSGGAGIFADLRAFGAASVWGCGVVAVSTVQSTAGLLSSRSVPARHLLAQIDEVFARQRVRSVKIGALGSVENVRGVTQWIEGVARALPIVLDPVMRPTRAARGGRLLEDKALTALGRLGAAVTLITPNAGEAERLLGVRVRTVEDAEGAALALVERGARAALVKGGHLAPRGSSRVTDVLAVGGRVHRLHAPRVGVQAHGTGCALASLIAGRLARATRVDDETLLESVRWAKRRLARGLGRAARIGQGMLVVPL